MGALALCIACGETTMAIKTGTSAPETINGTSSADSIYGKGGNDTLYGLGGADFLYGNYGNDVLIGGAGKDVLTGGPGSDTFKYLAFSDSRGTTVDLIKDLDTSSPYLYLQDKVDLSALGNATNLPSYNPSWLGAQAVFTYNATTNVTTLSWYEEGSSTAVFQLKFTGNVHYDQDNFKGIDPGPFPTEGDDSVFGDDGVVETIDFLGGDDFYHAFGGGGDKFIAGGSGNDYINSGYGNDNLRGGSGADYIDGGGGNDIIYGGTENDSLVGDYGNDTLYGGDGDDVLNGDEAFDARFPLGGFTGNDTLGGGSGYDTVEASGTVSEYSITKNADGSITLTDITPVDDESPYDWGTDTLINVEAIRFEDGIYIVATNTFTPFDFII